MIHYGDITKIKGSEVPIVDIITGGSPCQDLSVAGKRAGLEGERSGLFMEQIRIIKELRDECIRQLQMRGSDVNLRCVRPRYMVWENVPGAFSSNKGEDFRVVLEETARIADKDAVIPGPPKGKWSPSGCIMGDGWSIAWRVHDAQFWGVPQRRKRISLVADFGGESAPEILFESKSVSGDTAESFEQRQGAAGDTTEGIGETSYTLKIRGGREVDSNGKKAGKGALIQTEMSATLGVSQDQTLITLNEKIEDFVSAVNKDAKHQQDLIQSDLGIARTLAPGTHASGPHLTKTLVTKCLNSPVCYGISSYDSNAMKSSNPHSGIYEADTTRTLDNNGGNPACNQGGMIVLEGNGSRDSHKGDGFKKSDTMYTLNTVEQHSVCYQEDNVVGCNWDGSQVSPTLTSNNAGGNQRMPDKENFNAVICSETLHDQQAVVYGVDAYNHSLSGDVAVTLNAASGVSPTHSGPSVMTFDRPTVQSLEVYHCQTEEEKTQTLKARDYKDPQCVCYEADNPKTVGRLCISGYSKLGIQEAMSGMYIGEKKNE